MQTKTNSSLSFLTAALLFLGTLALTGHAATNTWTGGAGDGNWSSTANWDTALAASNSLTFSGNSQIATTNNNAGFVVGTNGGTAITFANNGIVGTNGFTLAGSSIVLNGNITNVASSTPITDTISLNLQLNGNRTLNPGANHSLIISGAITQDVATNNRTLTKGGSSTTEVILQNAGNSYGQTFLSAGTLTVNVAGGIANAGVASALGAGSGTNSLIAFSGATLNVTLGAGGTDRQVRIGSTAAGNAGGATINNNSANGSTPLVFSNAAFNFSAGTNITAIRDITLGGTNTDANEIRGVIANNSTVTGGLVSVTKAGGGLWILSALNTYSGPTYINGGTLVVKSVPGIANAGVASALGAGTGTNGQLNFNGAALDFTLGAGGTDRQVRIGSATATSTAGATIYNDCANGSTPLVFSSAAFNVPVVGVLSNRTLTLGGTNTDANQISGTITDNDAANGGLVSVAKAGTGLWILSGSNTYTGSTVIGGGTNGSNGVLRIASVAALPPATSIVGSTSLEGTSTLELAPGSYSVKNYLRGNINFAASSGQATLDFTNTAVTNVVTQGSGNKTISSSNVAVRFAGALDISALADSGTNKITTFAGNGGFTFDGPVSGPIVTNWTVIGTNGTTNIVTDLATNTGTVISTNFITSGFVMNGTGVAVLNASNTYSGPTDVQRGTLQVNGSTSTNALSVSNGATLAGLGTVGGDIFAEGALQPGSGATNGALTIAGNLNVATNGSVTLNIDSATDYDRLAGAASYVVNGTINVSAGTNYSPAVGNTFQLFSAAVGGTPTLNITPLSNSKFAWVTNSFASTGQISVATNSATPAPSGLSYSPSSQIGTVGTVITGMSPTVTGTVTNYSVSPALPAGLSIDAGTGVISGTPTAAATSASYTVTAANSVGSTTANVTISVGKATPSISAPPTASSIVQGQSLASSTLTGGTASVAGTFAWTDPSYVPVSAGVWGESVTFTPTDTANYNTATTSVSVTVVSQYNNWLQGETNSAANQLTYAIGGATSPTATNGVASTTIVTSNALSITAIVRTNDTNLTVTGQSITNLSVGIWATNDVSMSVPVDQTGATPGTTQRQTFTTSRTNTDTKKFLHLNTTLGQ
ncbi:MAG: hypothetical protein RIQ71_1458 [Verrucomicrobiota bacterium]|jgi:fibronectin-binding autotransporter adhesin